MSGATRRRYSLEGKSVHAVHAEVIALALGDGALEPEEAVVLAARAFGVPWRSIATALRRPERTARRAASRGRAALCAWYALAGSER